jgi:hypothetical protein
MTHRSRWAFVRPVRAVLAAAALVALAAGRLVAQGTTGKIEGTVRDQSGAPINGAQVFVVGSAFVATTNEQGYYFINNVPAGVMSVRAQYVGYQPAEVRNVRVFAGQTMTVDVSLEQRAVQVEAITVTVEANPIVPRDQVTSKGIIQGDVIDNLPVDNLSEVLRLQPGVVEGTRGITVRGGRPGETATYIDGVLVRSYNAQFRGFNSAGAAGGNIVQVGSNALEEASVTTGAIGSEFGEAQSGVIALVTRAGGPTYSGALAYSTDEISGQTYGRGLHRLEASFGGPLARNLTFFLSTTLQGQQSTALGKGWEDVPIYVLDGLDTSNPEAPNGLVTVPNNPGDPASDSQVVAIPAFTRYSTGARRPEDASDSYTFSGKLQYSYGAGSRISATLLQSRDQDRFFFPGLLYNPMARRGERQSSRALILNWTQNLTRSSANALFLEAYASWQRDEYISGQIDPQWLEDNRDPFAWFTTSSMDFLVNFDNFPIDDRLVENLRLGGGTCQGTRDIGGGNTAGACVPFINRNDLLLVGPYRTNPYGVTAGTTYFPSSGIGGGVGLAMSRERRLTARVNLDWQANRYHRFKFGGDMERINMEAYSSSLVEQIFMDAYREEPTKTALFAQDRLDLGDVVVELGLRWDRINSGILYPLSVARTFTDPLRQGTLPANPTPEETAAAQRCSAAATAMASAGATAGDTLAFSTCNFVEADPRTNLSPSLRISFPVTDRTGFRVSYSHQVQTPDFSQMATCASCDISTTNTNDVFGRPLDFGKSILFEFGIRHAFSDDMVLDVSAYNKDKVSDVAGRIVGFNDPVAGRTINYNVLTNEDFGNTRGVDIKLDRRIGSLFQGSVSYSYIAARSTGSDPLEYLGTISRQISTISGDRAPPPQASLPTRDDRAHNIGGALALNFPQDWRSGTTWGSLLQDVGAFATFRFASGLPYTLMENDGNGQRGPGNAFGLTGTADEPLNNSRTPWIKNVDLRLTKGLRFGSRDLTVFADFRNLFNFSNVLQVFAETGDIFNSVYENEVIDPIRSILANEAGDLVVLRQVTRPDGSTQLVQGIDLSNCGRYAYQAGGAGGVPNCLLLRGAERRFAIGQPDQFFDVDEQAAAFHAFYLLGNGPQTFRGEGLNLRVGFELNF